MTLILKTKTTATNSVGNIHGNTGPQDFVAMLDFARDVYYTKVDGARQDYDINDVISVTRSGGIAHFQDRYGIWRQAPANSPRMKYSEWYDAYGLFVGAHRSNLATSDANGSTIPLPAASAARVFLSWEGAGDASLTEPNLTLLDAQTIRGRKMRAYTRPSGTGATTAILNATGDVSRVQVEMTTNTSTLFPSERLGHGETVGADVVNLKSPLLDRMGANGSLFIRTVFPDGRAFGANFTTALLISLRTGNVNGGLYLQVRDGNQAVAANGLYRIADGGAQNSGAVLGSYNVSGRPSGTVRGLGWSDNGETVVAMTGGMFNTVTGLDPLPQFSSVRIGGDQAAWTGGVVLDGIITHCVLYDRQLSYDEMSLMATMWQ